MPARLASKRASPRGCVSAERSEGWLPRPRPRRTAGSRRPDYSASSPDSFAFLAFPDHLRNLLELLPGKVAVFHQPHQQRLGRAIKNAIDKLFHHSFNHLILRAGNLVNVGAVSNSLLEIILLLQDVHHRHDGRVGDFASLEERFINVSDGGCLETPDDLHDFQFLFGKSVTFLSHTK